MKLENLSDADILELQYHWIIKVLQVLEEINKVKGNNVTPIKYAESPIIKRDSKKYSKFRDNVLRRDKICQCCGSEDNLDVHHIFSFKYYNSLGADTNNGIVLCKNCHKAYHSKYGKKGANNPLTLIEFLQTQNKNSIKVNKVLSISDLLDTAKEVI